MAFDYPQPGFHFNVLFELVPQFPTDMQFQEVSGLDVEMEMEPYVEGGELRFTHQLPVRAKYGDVTLKRGKFLGSGVLHWCRQALENYSIKPINVLISLLNEEHFPVFNYYLINAFPIRLELSGLNAQSNELAVETMVLSYQYFQYYDPVSVALDLAASATASLDVNIGL